MKKKFFSTALLMLMIAALMVFAAGCGSEPDTSAAACDNHYFVF